MQECAVQKGKLFFSCKSSEGSVERICSTNMASDRNMLQKNVLTWSRNASIIYVLHKREFATIFSRNSF